MCWLVYVTIFLPHLIYVIIINLFIYHHNTYAIEIDSGLIVVCMRHMERSSDVVVVVVVVLIVVRRATVTLLLLRF